MDAREIETIKKQMKIFMPYAAGKLAQIRAERKRFVHYSSAENIFKIISSKTMWLRNTRCMADYSEVELGYDMLHHFFQQPLNRDAFYNTVNACGQNLAEESIALFDQWWVDIRFNTYICSISEHEDNEDGHGRLSMWRAFGQSTSRAAIVMRMPDEGSAEGLHVMLSPVAYFGVAEVEEQLWNVIRNIAENRDYLVGLGRDRLKAMIFFMLATGAVSIKHFGFLEEKEWRIIYLPRANPSKLITSSTEVVGGVPQLIHKIPLREDPGNDVAGVGIPALIDRIIIGPTVYAAPMNIAFIDALTAAGVTDAASRVVVSGIPIRS
jgi:hypothetical protein